MTRSFRLCSLSDIIRVIKQRRMRGPGHVAGMGGSTAAYRILMGKLQGMRPPGKPLPRWGIILK
jgi:hypothetical protein